MDVPDDHQSLAIPPSSSTEGKTPQRRSAGQLRRKISSATKTTYSRRVHSTKVVHTKRLSRGSARARGVTSKVKRNDRRTNKHPLHAVLRKHSVSQYGLALFRFPKLVPFVECDPNT
ncbi:unnamed protein product, partial [Dicrocoelium dendriticum]